MPPRYFRAKRLGDGSTAYYWAPQRRDIEAGFTLHGEALGRDLAAAVARADHLNRHLDDWRRDRGAARELDLQPGFGTLDWLVARYEQSPAFARVSQRSRPDYRREMALATEHILTNGQRVGALLLPQISAGFVDKLYAKLKVGPKGPRKRSANLAVRRLARAWDVVARLYRREVPQDNPWSGAVLEGGYKAKVAATRGEAYGLADALAAHGHPHLGAVALICYEWLQRPENVLDGHFRWSDWRPADRHGEVSIFHHKTGLRVWHPLEADGRPLYPEIEAWIARLPKLGPALVLTPAGFAGTGRHSVPHLYDHHYARQLVREARRAAGLPEHVTFDACRHGGMTELGDSGLTESEEMAISGHATPEAKRRYIKKSEAQRLTASVKRRAWVTRREE